MKMEAKGLIEDDNVPYILSNQSRRYCSQAPELYTALGEVRLNPDVALPLTLRTERRESYITVYMLTVRGLPKRLAIDDILSLPREIEESFRNHSLGRHAKPYPMTVEVHQGPHSYQWKDATFIRR